MATLKASTKALASNDPDDATYSSIETQIQSLTAQRDTLAGEIKKLLNGAAFAGNPFTAAKAFSLVVEGSVLIEEAKQLPH